MEYETTLYHLQIAIILLLHYLLHYATWQPSLIIYANFRLLLDLCLLPFYYFSLDFFFTIDSNPYNGCLFIFNSLQIFFTNSEYVV
jgi:hypothetical protein